MNEDEILEKRRIEEEKEEDAARRREMLRQEEQEEALEAEYQWLSRLVILRDLKRHQSLLVS